MARKAQHRIVLIGGPLNEQEFWTTEQPAIMLAFADRDNEFTLERQTPEDLIHGSKFVLRGERRYVYDQVSSMVIGEGGNYHYVFKRCLDTYELG